MVIGYGQDDRVCAYTSLIAQLEAPADLAKTAVTVLVDKEEIGSVGATGMASNFFENTIAEIMELAGEGGMLPLRRALSASSMLSRPRERLRAEKRRVSRARARVQQVHGCTREERQQRCECGIRGARASRDG